MAKKPHNPNAQFTPDLPRDRTQEAIAAKNSTSIKHVTHLAEQTIGDLTEVLKIAVSGLVEESSELSSQAHTSDHSGISPKASSTVANETHTSSPEKDHFSEERNEQRNQERDEKRDTTRDSKRDSERDPVRDEKRDNDRDATRDPERDQKRDQERDPARDKERDESRDGPRDKKRDSERDPVRDEKRDNDRDARRDSVRDQEIIDALKSENTFLKFQQTAAALLEKLQVLCTLILDDEKKNTVAQEVNGLLDEVLKIAADIPLDYRKRKQLENMENALKDAWKYSWPREKKHEKYSLKEYAIETRAWLANTVAYIGMPSRFSTKFPMQTEKPHPKRPEYSQLLSDIQSAKKSGHPPYKNMMKVLGVGAIVWFGGDWLIKTDAEQFEENMERQIEVVNDVSVEKVEGRKITVSLPTIPAGMKVYAYSAEANNQLGRKNSRFDINSGELELPDTVQPNGGAVDLYFHAVMPETNGVLSLHPIRVDNVGAVAK